MAAPNCLKFEILDIVRTGRAKTYFPRKNIGTFLLSLRLCGNTVFMHGDDSFTLMPDDVFFVPMGSKYSQYDTSDVEFVCFHLEIDGNAPDKMQICRPDNPLHIRELFCKAAELWQKKECGYEYMCMSILYCIFAETLAPSLSRTEHGDNILAASVSYLNTHLFDSDLSPGKICEASNISRVYFNRLFLEQFGVTPVKYINHKRIEKAKLLLKGGSFAREEIAALCGFNDVKYFYTVFKSITGMTTGEYCRSLSREQ